MNDYILDEVMDINLKSYSKPDKSKNSGWSNYNPYYHYYYNSTYGKSTRKTSWVSVLGSFFACICCCGCCVGMCKKKNHADVHEHHEIEVVGHHDHMIPANDAGHNMNHQPYTDPKN